MSLLFEVLSEMNAFARWWLVDPLNHESSPIEETVTEGFVFGLNYRRVGWVQLWEKLPVDRHLLTQPLTELGVEGRVGQPRDG